MIVQHHRPEMKQKTKLDSLKSKCRVLKFWKKIHVDDDNEKKRLKNQ